MDYIGITCTTTDGTQASRKYAKTPDPEEEGCPQTCACGNKLCDEYTRCCIGDNCCEADCSNGCCCPVEKNFPTPAPTVAARGDPHLVNLQGEHFDINHPGVYTLLRVPQDVRKFSEMQIVATVTFEHGRPCTTYITQVELTGKWFGNQSIQVRSFLKSQVEGELHAELGMRMFGGDASLAAPWQSIEAIMVEEQKIGNYGMEVIMYKSQWYPKKRVPPGMPMVAGMFQFDVRYPHTSDSAKFIFRQDLPDQEHLNLAVRRISALGRMDIGGLIGFDTHARSLEAPSKECNQYRAQNLHRVMSQDERDGYTYRPLWKERWDQIRHNRDMKHAGHNVGDNSQDNEAAASLFKVDTKADNLMCKCPAPEDPTGEFQDGVIVDGDAMTASWGIISWD